MMLLLSLSSPSPFSSLGAWHWQRGKWSSRSYASLPSTFHLLFPSFLPFMPRDVTGHCFLFQHWKEWLSSPPPPRNTHTQTRGPGHDPTMKDVGWFLLLTGLMVFLTSWQYWVRKKLRYALFMRQEVGHTIGKPVTALQLGPMASSVSIRPPGHPSLVSESGGHFRGSGADFVAGRSREQVFNPEHKFLKWGDKGSDIFHPQWKEGRTPTDRLNGRNWKESEDCGWICRVKAVQHHCLMTIPPLGSLLYSSICLIGVQWSLHGNPPPRHWWIFNPCHATSPKGKSRFNLPYFGCHLGCHFLRSVLKVFLKPWGHRLV